MLLTLWWSVLCWISRKLILSDEERLVDMHGSRGIGAMLTVELGDHLLLRREAKPLLSSLVELWKLWLRSSLNVVLELGLWNLLIEMRELGLGNRLGVWYILSLRSLLSAMRELRLRSLMRVMAELGIEVRLGNILRYMVWPEIVLRLSRSLILGKARIQVVDGVMRVFFVMRAQPQ
jgi:hypothetical protein